MFYSKCSTWIAGTILTRMYNGCLVMSAVSWITQRKVLLLLLFLTLYLLRPVIQPYILIHCSVKMITSCLNIFARIRNNPKKPLIAVIRYNGYLKSICSFELLLIMIKHGISGFPHVRYSKAASTCERPLVGAASTHH